MLLALTLAVAGMSAVAGDAGSCNTSPVFAFSRALYHAHYSEAEGLLREIENKRPHEVARFLEQVMYFKRAYDRGDQKQMKQSLGRIDAQLKQMTRGSSIESIDEMLVWANIMIHASRMHLALGNILRAAGLAREGRKYLDQVLRRDALHPDALLSDGLYLYYSGSGEESLDWAMALFGLRGDRFRGVEQVEQAVNRSPDHAFEALRSLLVDVAWNRNDTCRYAALLENPETRHAGLFEPYAMKISTDLFCGHPRNALEQLSMLQSAGEDKGLKLTRVQQEWLFAAQLNALAALGQVHRIEALAEEQAGSNGPRAGQVRFALARALDVQDRHAQAEPLYRQVLKSNLDESYHLLARAYIDRPYRAPRAYVNHASTALRFACGEGSARDE